MRRPLYPASFWGGLTSDVPEYPDVVKLRVLWKPGCGLAIGAVLVCLSGCVSPSYSLTPEEANIPPCADHTPVPVESLDDTARATCIVNVLVFPDGTVVPAGVGVGAYAPTLPGDGSAPFTYSTYGVGIYGIAAAKTNAAGTHSDWWGRPEAIKKVQDAFGDIGETMN